MDSKIMLFLCSVFTLFDILPSLIVQNLGGEWNVKDFENEYNFSGLVPGGIYTDLMREKIIDDVFYRFNDIESRWVSKKRWIYSRKFTVNSDVLIYDNINLVFDGIDTFSKVLLNNIEIGSTDSMFIQYIFDIKSHLRVGENIIEVQFKSPVNYAKELFEKQAKNYEILPLCVPKEYNGECHVNLARKMQASFSWDWGPALPSVGIWKDIYLEAYNSTLIRNTLFDLSSHNNSDLWEINIKTYFANSKSAFITGTVNVTLETDVGLFNVVYKNINISTNNLGEFLFHESFRILKKDVQLWWPNGYGDQKLYKLQVNYSDSNGIEFYNKSVKIGFRTIELVQDQIKSGRMFYFKINNVPVFAKGSNSIPINILPELGGNETVIKFLLKSAKEAHMNMLRVWGGGVYEGDAFYNIADELGILIWQDFMFACSMYPTNKEFLSIVKQEVRYQVRRLQHHPSVVLWAGNNENEAALRQNWYGTSRNFSLYKEDYLKLYIDVIRTELLANDRSRPYLSSSPTNGIKSEEEGFVAEDPQSKYYGDVHYYNYVFDGWKTTFYPVTRFASEYGYQSLPSINSFQTATHEKNDLIYGSDFLNSRQHLPDGYIKLEVLTTYQLDLPEKNSANYLLVLSYYSQIIQAVAQKIQSEYYRQWRSSINKFGQGYTMGALYWQLNDVWVAPTWSGIDFNNNWKMLHYYAKKFFAPVLITADLTFMNKVNLYVVSDLLHNITNVNAIVSVYNWNSFEPVHQDIYDITVIAESSQLIKTYVLKEFLEQLDGKPCGQNVEAQCFLYFSLIARNDSKNLSNNFLFPSPLKEANLEKPNISISLIISVSERHFIIEITSDQIALFVWIEANGIQGTFSDNGFLQLTPKVNVTLITNHYTTVKDLEKSLMLYNLLYFKNNNIEE